jgi:hypothetical protein
MLEGSRDIQDPPCKLFVVDAEVIKRCAQIVELVPHQAPALLEPFDSFLRTI